MALTKIVPGGQSISTATKQSVLATSDPIERHRALTKAVEQVKKTVTELQAQRDLLTQQREQLAVEAKDHGIKDLETLPETLQQYEDYASQLMADAEEKIKKAKELLGIE